MGRGPDDVVQHIGLREDVPIHRDLQDAGDAERRPGGGLEAQHLRRADEHHRVARDHDPVPRVEPPELAREARRVHEAVAADAHPLREVLEAAGRGHLRDGGRGRAAHQPPVLRDLQCPQQRRSPVPRGAALCRCTGGKPTRGLGGLDDLGKSMGSQSLVLRQSELKRPGACHSQRLANDKNVLLFLWRWAGHAGPTDHTGGNRHTPSRMHSP